MSSSTMTTDTSRDTPSQGLAAGSVTPRVSNEEFDGGSERVSEVADDLVDPTTTARLRFSVGVAHLSALAGLLHVTPETAGFAVFDAWQVVLASILVACSVAALWLHPASGIRRLRSALFPCISLPPWNEDKTEAWIPSLGWRRVDNDLRLEVEKRFAVPMVVIAVLVLPLFGVEHFLRDAIATSPVLTALVAIASAAVWGAFALEFIVGCTLAEKKLGYVKQHWLDAIIVLLPLVAFLRMARLARLTKLQKTARVFRLRGVAMRLWNAFVVFELIERALFRTPEKRLAHLEKKRTALLEDLAALDSKITSIKRRQPDN